MVQYNANPHMYTNTTGWTASGLTLAATADGGRVTSDSGTNRYINMSLFNVPDGIKCTVNGLQVRRNSASSYGIKSVAVAGFTADTVRDMFSPGPVGSFVSYPLFTSTSAAAGGVGVGLRITFPDNVPLDITIKGVNLFDTVANAGASAAIDSGDAAWTATLTSNSKTISVKHNAANNEAFNSLSWNWGDGTTTATNPRTNAFSAVSHTYATAGIYTVTATASNYAGQSITNAQTLTVPSGTFTAAYAYEAAYLNLDVDATSSVAPTNDPIDAYTWVWGDGTANSTGQYASHTYAAPGTYNVKLTTVTNETLRTSSVTKSIAITAPPNPDNYFTAIKNLLEVTFNPSITDGTSYSWTFGDGQNSTAQAPVHIYDVAGTYAVSLTVNGTLTTTQNVVVTSVYTPIKNVGESLRLEVSLPPATIYNRLKNPNGELGAYGWVTPVGGSYIVSSSTSNTTIDKGISGSKLVYRSSGSTAQTFYTQSVRATAGQYVAAQWISPYVDGYVRGTVEALDASGTVLGSSATTGYFQSSTTLTRRTTPYLLPTGTAFARIRYNHTSDAGSAVPAAGKIVQLRRVMLATASTSAALTSLPYSEYENWYNIIGPTHEINIEREALNVGIMQAQILDATLDPAVSNTIRPGQAVRVRVNTADASGNSNWESIYTGTISDAQVTYLRDLTNNPKKTQIVLSASDNITPLAQNKESRGVSAVVDLPVILEDKGVPYEINGSSGQIPTAQIVAQNENASALDQIAITRDNNQGYAFVDRNNVFIARDSVYMPTVPAGIVDESAYSDVDATFSFDNCINSVIVKWLRYNATSGETEEITYGPYSNNTSIDQYGLHQKEFTFQGAVENPSIIASKAQAILNANSLPVRHINSVRVPVRYQEDLTTSKALLDLYDLVTLKYDRTQTQQNVRITGLKHTISPKRWSLELVFDLDGAVASPQLTPSPPPTSGSTVKVTGTSAGVVWSSTWNQYDTGANRLEYTRIGNVHSIGGSIRNTAAATLGTTTQIVSLADNPDYRPPPLTINEMSVSNTNGHNVRVLIESSGLIRIQKMPNSSSWSWSAGEFFPFFITWVA